MSDAPYDSMAREFLNLWQKQMASVVRDKQFVRAMLDALESLQAGYEKKQGTTATSNASHAPDDEHGVLAQLAFRVAMCERRISELESRTRPSKTKSGRTRKTPKRNSTRGKKTR